MAFLMFVDGVLRSHTGSPIYQGLALYRVLNDHNKVLLLCDDKDKDETWLKAHKINKVDDFIGRDLPLPGQNPALRQVEHCRSQGPVELVITSDPELSKELLAIGVTSLMFLHPTYLREEFRPDGRFGRKSWDAIVQEIAEQQDTYRDDSRVQE